MSTFTAIANTTAALSGVRVNVGGYSAITLFADGLAGAETVSVLILGGSGAVPYKREGAQVVLTAAQPIVELPPGANWAIDKSATVGSCGVYWAIAESGLATGRSLTLSQRVQALFAKYSAVGGMWDFSDWSTVFQRPGGQEPVIAVSQPAGFALDKSRGLTLGPELATNGGFDSNISPWVSPAPADALATWDAGRLKLANVSGLANGGMSAHYALSTVVGKTYQVVATMDATTPVRLSAFPVGPDQFFFLMPSTGIHQARLVFTATSTSSVISLDLANDTAWLGGANTAWLDNFSVREIATRIVTQPTSAARPQTSARVNLLTRTDNLADAVWGAESVGLTLAAQTITETGANSVHALQGVSGGIGPFSQVFSAEIKKTGGPDRYVYVGVDNSGTRWGYAIFNAQTGAFVKQVNDGIQTDVTAYSSTPTADGGFLLSATANSPLAGYRFVLGLTDNPNPASARNPGGAYVGDPAVTLTVKPQRELGVAATPTRYQRVTTASDYDAVGFPRYVLPDGVDDFLSTPANLDLTTCDKAVVGMGYTKVDDATRMQMELSADWNANSGVFGLANGAGQAQYMTRGTGAVTAAIPPAMLNTYTAMVGRTGGGAGGVGRVWVNGIVGADSAVAAPVSNFGAFPLYLLSRGGTTLFSNTPTRRAIVFGIPVAQPQMTDPDIEIIRQWLMEGA